MVDPPSNKGFPVHQVTKSPHQVTKSPHQVDTLMLEIWRNRKRNTTWTWQSTLPSAVTRLTCWDFWSDECWVVAFFCFFLRARGAENFTPKILWMERILHQFIPIIYKVLYIQTVVGNGISGCHQQYQGIFDLKLCFFCNSQGGIWDENAGWLQKGEKILDPKCCVWFNIEFSIWVPRTSQKLWAVKVTQRNCGLFASWL